MLLSVFIPVINFSVLCIVVLVCAFELLSSSFFFQTQDSQHVSSVRSMLKGSLDRIVDSTVLSSTSGVHCIAGSSLCGGALHVMTLFLLVALQVFFLSFDCGVSRCDSLIHTWSSLNFLNVWVNTFHQNRQVFRYCFFKWPLFFVPPPRPPSCNSKVLVPAVRDRVGHAHGQFLVSIGVHFHPLN